MIRYCPRFAWMAESGTSSCPCGINPPRRIASTLQRITPPSTSRRLSLDNSNPRFSRTEIADSTKIRREELEERPSAADTN